MWWYCGRLDLPVEMDRVRNWSSNAVICDLLNDPKHPFALVCQLNHVLGGREGVVVFHDIRQDWLAPVDVDLLVVDAPDDNVLLVRADVRQQE